MRLINADALKEKAFGKRGGLIHTSDIDEMPTIEPQPQTAHWVIDGHHIQCSQCGETMCNTDREGDPIPRNFCPNCGARMVTE